MDISIPRLIDFEIHIPPGGKTDALVEATITWEGDLKTRAVSSDQVLAAVKATERMINLLTMKQGSLNSMLSSDEVTIPEPKEVMT